MSHKKSLVPTPMPNLAVEPERSSAALAHARDWLAHVEAGRIGGGASVPAQLASPRGASATVQCGGEGQ